MIVKQKSNRIASDCTWQRNTDHTLLPIVQQTNEQNGVRHKHKWLLHHNEISNAFNKDWWHIFVLESTLEFQLPESWACEEFDSTTAWKQFAMKMLLNDQVPESCGFPDSNFELVWSSPFQKSLDSLSNAANILAKQKNWVTQVLINGIKIVHPLSHLVLATINSFDWCCQSFDKRSSALVCAFFVLALLRCGASYSCDLCLCFFSEQSNPWNCWATFQSLPRIQTHNLQFSLSLLSCSDLKLQHMLPPCDTMEKPLHWSADPLDPMLLCWKRVMPFVCECMSKRCWRTIGPFCKLFAHHA